jgi:hypothetical protein
VTTASTTTAFCNILIATRRNLSNTSDCGPILALVVLKVVVVVLVVNCPMVFASFFSIFSRAELLLVGGCWGSFGCAVFFPFLRRTHTITAARI